MSDQEKAVLKSVLKDLVDKELPLLIAAEEQRLPVAYQPLVAAVMGAVLPGLQKSLDAAIDGL